MLNLTYPSNLDYNVPFIDLRDKLPVNPNYTWSQLAGVREVDALNTIVVHHDGMSKASTAKYSDIQLAERIAIAHISSIKNHEKGDAGFPYDLWIRNGIIYWTNDIEQREYGVAGNNGYTVNVCVSGDYHNYDVLTDADRKALYAAILMLKEALPADKFIKGHNELQQTHCPGFDMNKVRSDIADIENKILFEQSASRKREMAFQIANQSLYLYNMANGKLPDGSPSSEGQQTWAINMLHEFYPFLKQKGLVK